MTALARERMLSFERWTYHVFTLASGRKAYQGGMAFGDPTTGKVVQGVSGTGKIHIGTFAETIDATSADQIVNVNLGIEIEVVWWENSATNTITAANVFGLAYAEDDQTVGSLATGFSVVGRIWAVDPVRGVAVQKLGYAGA